MRRSILGPQRRINSYSLVEDSILLHGAWIGRNSKIKRAIVDEGVEIPDGSVGYDHDADRKAGYTVTEQGIVVVSNCLR